jgi:filamentous hemagglutinin family protein
MTRTRALRPALLLSTALAAGMMTATPARAQNLDPATLPDLQGGVPGGVTIGTSGPANSPTLNIGLSNPSHILQWNSFNIGENATVAFCPSGCATTTAVLNRINDSNPTLIFGNLNAPSNLTVFLINNNGIVFGNGSSVNVGGLIASTANITNDDFNAGLVSGNYAFTGASAGISIGSTANITTTGGPLVLIAASNFVDYNPPGNQDDAEFDGMLGTLNSNGDVAIALASNVTVSMAPGSPLSISLSAGTSFDNPVVVGGTINGKNVYVA